MNVQFKKGVLELCVLSLLNSSDRYGYEISDLISREINISESTIYPILRKLKDDGMITSYIAEDSGGPPRKYYKMTTLGQEEFSKTKAEWLAFAETIKRFLQKGDKR